MPIMLLMATQHDSTRPKVSVQARVDADAVDKLDELTGPLNRSRSELVDFACQEIAKLTPEEIMGRMLKSAKAKGKKKE